jgi:hypothetical protein
MLISHHQNAGRNHNLMIADIFLKMATLKSLGMARTNQNYIKNRLSSGYACYHSVQNPSPSPLLSKSLKIKVI